MLELLLVTLATYRITRAVNIENGPKMLLDWIRFKAGVTRNENGQQIARAGTLADFVTCFYCLSFWVALIIALVCFRDLLLGLAAGGLCALARDWLDGTDKHS